MEFMVKRHTHTHTLTHTHTNTQPLGQSFCQLFCAGNFMARQLANNVLAIHTYVPLKLSEIQLRIDYPHGSNTAYTQCEICENGIGRKFN